MTRSPSTERTALLPREPSPRREGSSKSQANRPVVICVLSLMFFTMFAFYHVLAPKLKLLELTICRSFYETRDPSAILPMPTWPGYHIDENKCKHNSIQQDLSNLRSWSMFFDGLCTVLLSIPYGSLADRHGRKLVYMCSILGLVLSNAWFVFVCSHYKRFSVTAVLFSSLFLVIGGGSWVVLAISSTMATDVADEQTRSTVLYWLVSAFYLGYVAGTGLAPITMQTAWLPFFLALLSAFCAAMIAALMPRTQPDDETDGRRGNIVPHEDHTFRSKIRNMVRTSSKHINFLRSHLKLVLIALVVPLLATRSPLSELILPYVSKRYSWPLSWAGAIDAVNGCISLLLGIFVLPFIVQTLSRRRFTAIQTDSCVARYSAGALCAGALIVGLAPQVGIMISGWIVFSTGFGARMSAIAIATTFVSPNQVARLNTAVVSMEALVDMTVSPLIWKSWSAGLAVGGAGLGFPWFVVAAAMLLASLILWSLDFKTQSVDVATEGD